MKIQKLISEGEAGVVLTTAGGEGEGGGWIYFSKKISWGPRLFKSLQYLKGSDEKNVYSAKVPHLFFHRYITHGKF